MNSLEVLLLVAILVEAVVQAAKLIYTKEKGVNTDVIVALVVSVGVCAGAQVDLFKLVGIEIAIPYIGAVLTGVIVSRGSNAIHDLLALVRPKIL
jgi:hypothetical protein